MSSKYLEKAWCYKTVSMEEKLLLVALAELSDRDGAFITSMTELKTMMCASERSLDNLISKLSVEQTLVGTNKSTPAYRSEGKVKGRLNFDTYVAPNDHVAPYGQQHTGYSNQPPQQAQQQSAQQPQDTYRNTNRLSSFHRSQVAPINKSITGKSINIMELSPSVVEDWAEMIMFKSGFVGQTNVWAAFVERIKETPNRQLYTLDELTSRLHSHLHSEKTYRQPGARKQASNKPQVKHSALDVLEEKISNFNFNDDN
ncbi:hypothetical protein [Vibrio tapetis]|uniref:Uncharacterized protein n=1 Tax=Vibrio tapetis subsp. tapetis TaxID=1671868 RepID=A0A2N8Z8B7_9VIBR|nr:hypothetical protein [Vibrio tapetis]SON48141.1 conserved protein of unknown function [Vibrio tapetis subsp. tapetis]